ncbi:MAG: HupE/UreJ family protein [Candidatus Binatia bacterium]
MCPSRPKATVHTIVRQAFQPLLVLLLLLLPTTGFAHIDPTGAGEGGFASGMRHPVTGLDHVVAMVAVGLWGAQLRAPAMWLLPVLFPLVMAIGGVIGVVGVALPGVNLGIAASGILLGAMVAAEAKPPLWATMLLVGSFAIFHGHAHGTALPAFGVPILFATGFVVATGVLHLCGIVIGLLVRWPTGSVIVRVAGAAITLVGGFFLAVHLTSP